MQGLTEMWMWINIITQDITYREHKRKSSMTNLTPPNSPWSRHLYSSTLPTSASSYSQSSYSPLSSSPTLSRPCSQLSESSLSRLSSPSTCPTSFPCHSSILQPYPSAISTPTIPLQIKAQPNPFSYQARCLPHSVQARYYQA